MLAVALSFDSDTQTFTQGFLGLNGDSSSLAYKIGEGARTAIDYGLIAVDIINTPFSPTPDVGLIGAAGITSRAVGREVAGTTSRFVDDAALISRRGPDFVVTPRGDAIPIPTGATGPYPTRGVGFQFTGGSGGAGLSPRVSNVRIMEPTTPRGPSPGYPSGYVNYSNSLGQSVNPYTGRTIPPNDPMWHLPLRP